jgi:hypothetical protein
MIVKVSTEKVELVCASSWITQTVINKIQGKDRNEIGTILRTLTGNSASINLAIEANEFEADVLMQTGLFLLRLKQTGVD